MRFGFQIKRRRQYQTKELMGWEVYLPHSCDNWDIAEEEPSRAAAIAALKSFIDEAQSALEFLESAAEDWTGHYGPDADYRWDIEHSAEHFA